MTKNEKEIAAIYLSGCFDEMRIAGKNGDNDAKARAEKAYKDYSGKIKALLVQHFELFALDYEKAVIKPLQEIYKMTQVFYSQRVNGEQMKYPA